MASIPAPVPRSADTAAQELRQKYHDELPAHNLRALWHNDIRVFDMKSNTSCIPYVWKYSEQRQILLRAEHITSTAESKRRALLMVNPGLKRAPFTTDTLLAAWQLLMPGERALCHRHTIFAIRFLIEGSKGYTTVGGHKMMMERGDLILTTQREFRIVHSDFPYWHNHGNEGTDPIVWLDGLDLPMFEGSFPINFQIRLQDHPDFAGQRFSESTLVSGRDAPRQYKWTEMKKNLDAEAGSYARLEYINPEFPDGHISRTMAAFAERLDPGPRSALRQETANTIVHVVERTGTSVIKGRDGVETILEWAVGDKFALPSWYAHTHTASAGGAAFLFSYSDSQRWRSWVSINTRSRSAL
ncbi:RmlC-like cupin domain-containing protein [Mycena vulgaris]|nr:RmlC-like cupin domain-containing protein [Mycena vulgaris]